MTSWTKELALTKASGGYKIGSMTTDQTWEVRFSALRQYVDEHGDALVPVKYVAWVPGHGDIPLGAWVSYLRTRKKNGSLTKEQVAALESLPGWAWKLTPGPVRDEDRDREIVRLRKEGRMTLASIGAKFGISRQRVLQIIQRYESASV